MHFAVLQRSLDALELTAVQRAFQAAPGLVAADARPVINNAFGILVKGRTIEQAMALQSALQAEGIESAVIAESDMPELPPTKFVHQIECLPEALVIHDPLGRPVNYAWADLFLVAAGHVQMIEFNRIRKETNVPVYRPGIGGQPELVTELVVDYSTHEEHLPRLLVEIILKNNSERFSIVVEKAGPQIFQYLGDRRTKNLEQNTSLLVQDLMRFAPHTAYNRGAVCLVQNQPSVLMYPSKNAFYEEIIWLLWQLRESGMQTAE